MKVYSTSLLVKSIDVISFQRLADLSGFATLVGMKIINLGQH